ncbi:MAG: extensin family protein [Phreatobacter sp.]|uniref:extensin family protein n=1 Tax=Phreatobacter sp. TaxID=1966341 RepID=UPI001A452EBA|nr:extensin family protein [Phreatobacter sp.]MBL8568119.1 extensin family protein [Phreatobacter sp.]
MVEQRGRRQRVQFAALATITVVSALGMATALDIAEARQRRQRVPLFSAPLPEPRPSAPAEPAEAAPAMPAQPPGESAAAPPRPGTCAERLAAMGVTFQRPSPPARNDARCVIEDAVQIERMQDGGTVLRWPDRPILACDAAERFASFTRDALRPMARGILGADLVAAGTGSGFECRPRSRLAGAKLSAHGQGLAVDIAWFELDGRRRVVVETPASDAERRFLSAVRKAACGWFTTVLGPGSDAAHANHLHFDAERRGRDGQSRLCQ